MSEILPVTKAERMRGLMVWMLFGAGLVCTALAVGSLLIAWLGAWPAGTEAQRLDIVGRALIGGLAGMGAVIVSLAIGGPVGRLKGKVGLIEIDAEGDGI
jgi:hypothetical protein